MRILIVGGNRLESGKKQWIRHRHIGFRLMIVQFLLFAQLFVCFIENKSLF